MQNGAEQIVMYTQSTEVIALPDYINRKTRFCCVLYNILGRVYCYDYRTKACFGPEMPCKLCDTNFAIQDSGISKKHLIEQGYEIFPFDSSYDI